LFGSTPDELARERAADAASAPMPQYRHASDVSVGQEACRPDGTQLRIEGDRMHRACVPIVPFQLARHALLVYEYQLAYRPRERHGFIPIEQAYEEIRMHRGRHAGPL